MRHRAVGMAHPPADRHERRAVHRRAQSRDRCRLDAELSERLRELHAEAYLRRAESSSRCPGARELLAPPPRRQVPFAIATSGRMAHCGLRAGAARPARRRAGHHPRLGGARQARPAPVPRRGPPARRRPGGCFVVGDSVWDLLAAQRAGALGIGLLSGGYGREELERSGAYRVYADPAEMLTRLEEVGVRPIR